MRIFISSSGCLRGLVCCVILPLRQACRKAKKRAKAIALLDEMEVNKCPHSLAILLHLAYGTVGKHSSSHSGVVAFGRADHASIGGSERAYRRNSG